MKKLLFVAVIVLVLAISCSFAASKFSDVNGTKYETAVSSLNSKGVIDGFTDGTFRPQNSVTRAQLCKLLVEALDLKKNDSYGLVRFKDVDNSMWFYDYVRIAIDNGVVVGYQDNTFKPNNDVNYNEMITMIIRAMGKESAMTDKTWPSAYIAYATYYGLLSNISYPDATLPAIRGDVSIALYNMLNRIEEEKSKQEVLSVKYGFVEKTSTKNKVDYATIEGKTYPVAYRSSSFTADTFAVYETSNLTDEITLGAYYSVKDLDGNADIVTHVTGKVGAQEVKVAGGSKYVDYFTSANITKYKSYGICVITVNPNSKDYLEVTRHSTKSTIEDVKFEVGDRIVEDSRTKVFLVFKGLDVDDTVNKGKFTPAVEYATISYKWDGDHPSAATLPKSEDVEIGTKYHVKYPQYRGYEFYVTNLSTESFTVTKDFTIKIGTVGFNDYCTVSYKWAYGQSGVSGVSLPKSATVEYGERYYPTIPSNRWGYTFYFTNLDTASFIVTEDTTLFIDYTYQGGIITDDDDDDPGGHAGSNMPLIDKVSKTELKEALEYALENEFNARSVTIKKANFSNNDTDSVKFDSTFDLFFDEGEDLMGYTAGSGVEDYDDWAVRNKSLVGILETDGSSYYVRNLGTGW